MSGKKKTGTAQTNIPRKRERRRGEGSLQKKGKKWYLRRSTGTMDDKGRTIYSVTCLNVSSRSAAETAAEELLREEELQKSVEYLEARLNAAKGAATDAAFKRSAVSLDNAFKAFHDSLARGRIAERTMSMHGSRYAAFRKFMSEIHPEVASIGEVTQGMADEFMATIERRFTATTFNQYRQILSQIWKVLAKKPENGVAANPWLEIARKPMEVQSRRELSVEELASVMAKAEGEMRVLFAVGIYTGLRLGDAVSLDWSMMDLANGFIQLPPIKTKRHGTWVRIPISPVLKGILEEIPRHRRSGPVTPGLLSDYRRDSSDLSNRIQGVFRSCGIETQTETGNGRRGVLVGFHSLRHTFVSLCANGGVPLAVVQAIVGHTSAAMTRHYFHVADDALRGAAEALPDVARKEQHPKDRREKRGSDALKAFRDAANALAPEEFAEAAKAFAEAMAKKAGG